MNWVFWFLIIIMMVILWISMICLFRPLGKIIKQIIHNIDFIINGNDDDNKVITKESED